MSSEPVKTAPEGDEPLAVRLERGGVAHYPQPPFPLPDGDDRDFLLGRKLGRLAHKNISYDPTAGHLGGCAGQDAASTERLRRLLADFSRAATAWLAGVLPHHSRAWQLDRVSLRTEEEATRKLRQTARNDLLHVDAFPSRPTNGHRLLRVFANINPSEPRVWMTSDPFGKLLQRYGEGAGLPGQAGGWLGRMRDGVIGLFRPGRRRRSAYDSFMLRFHDFLKGYEPFQERGPKRLWTFGPNSVWVAMTDGCSHAVLRGRGALEHSYFVAPEGLTLPDESPAALLEQFCRQRGSGRAA
jgi:hypothetical protein